LCLDFFSADEQIFPERRKTMAVKRLDCFALDVEDKPGVLAQLVRQLRDARVNLKGLWAFSEGQGKGKILCVPQNSKKFLDGMNKIGLIATKGTVFYTSGADKVGALCKVLDTIEQAGVNLQALDALGLGGRYGAYIWTESSDVETVARALKA
jgi:hypothetical protein